MRVIIVDDERRILQDLEDTIRSYKEFEVVGTYINPSEALENIPVTNPECAFLDIEMPGMTGIDLAERMLAWRPDIDIVFITAFNHFATQAFEVNAMDYLLKPVHPARFEKTVEKLVKNKKKPLFSDSVKILIRSFGGFDLLIDGIPIKWSRSKARELLAYLLHFEGIKKSKYVICEELWPEFDPKRGLAHLQTAMCSLRKSLGTIGQENIKINYSDESYLLFLENVTWDVREFEKMYESIKKGYDAEKAEKVVALYLGDYMGSEDWNWATLTTESYGRKYELLLKLISEQSYRYGNYILTVDSLLKLAGRQLLNARMQLLLAEAAYNIGGSSGLSQQVQLLRNIYLEEQGMELDAETFHFCKEKGVNIQ